MFVGLRVRILSHQCSEQVCWLDLAAFKTGARPVHEAVDKESVPFTFNIEVWAKTAVDEYVDKAAEAEKQVELEGLH